MSSGNIFSFSFDHIDGLTKKDEDRIELYKNMSDNEKNALYNQIFNNNLIDFMYDSGYVPVIYNGCYGGPGMSDEAKFLCKLFDNFKSPESIKNSPDEDDCYDDFHNLFASDEIKYKRNVFRAKIIMFLGERANSKYSKLVFDFVKIKYFKYIRTHEYDGLEDISFDINTYKLNETGKILESELIAEEKVLKIKEIYDCKIEDAIVGYKYALKLYQEERETVKNNL